jgi:hypothetical protein
MSDAATKSEAATKKLIVETLNLGQTAAENEARDLSQYFVETDQWKQIYNGDIDVILGYKGSGKSAIYFLLDAHREDLAKKGILFTPGERLVGNPVFAQLRASAPVSEEDFEALWKLYFLSLVGNIFKKQGAASADAKSVIRYLELEGLIEKDFDLALLLQRVINYILSKLHVAAVEGGARLDPDTGKPNTVYARILFGENKQAVTAKDAIQFDELLKRAKRHLQGVNRTVWIALDRLDAVFDNTPELEKRALKSLFRVYRHHFSEGPIRLKIFARTDIWVAILKDGFREATHIEKKIELSWPKTQLVYLISKRLLSCEALREFYDAKESQSVDTNISMLNNRMFEKSFPDAQKQPVDYIMENLADGASRVTPRDFIRFFKSCREEEQRRIEIGAAGVGGKTLFHPETGRHGFRSVSQHKLLESIYAEYPDLKVYIEGLSKLKNADFGLKTVAKAWGVNEQNARLTARRLKEIGVLRGGSDDSTLSIPKVFCYELGVKLPR